MAAWCSALQRKLEFQYLIDFIANRNPLEAEEQNDRFRAARDFAAV
jgi:hypothetical protein